MPVATTEKLSDTVGALVVGVDRERLLDDETLPAWTLDALEAHGALVFRGLHLDDATQVAFSKAKGSVPVVRNVDVSSFPTYQQESSKSLWALPVLLSVAHGEAMSPEFQEGFYDAVSTYVRTRDPGAFADGLADAVSRDKLPPR